MATSPAPRGNSSDLSGPATVEDSLEARNTQTLIATEADNVASTTTAVKARTRTRKRKQVDHEVKEEEDEAFVDIVATTSKRQKTIATITTERKTKTTRKTKTKPAETAAAPLMARTSGAKMLIGAHVSMAKGLSYLFYDRVD
jgi:hypothetical protein